MRIGGVTLTNDESKQLIQATCLNMFLPGTGIGFKATMNVCKRIRLRRFKAKKAEKWYNMKHKHISKRN